MSSEKIPIAFNTGESPVDEQVICVSCGFCCDGTLFKNAVLEAGEKGNLPEKIESGYFINDGKEFFRLPCLYFDRKCTIYDQKKAVICSAFRCKLLRDFAKNKFSKSEALEIIKNAKIFREELFELYYSLSGNRGNIYFKELIMELHKINSQVSGQNAFTGRYKLLTARCNIFEALLTRHFRSAKEFNDLMETSNEDNQTGK